MTADFRAGVAAQPENLEDGAADALAALAAADLGPLRAGTVVFTGIGASWYALLPAVRALRAGGRRVIALPAPQLVDNPRLGDAYVVVSQSGKSAELLIGLDDLGDVPVYAVSAVEDSPIVDRAGTWLPLGPRPDTPVSTLSYTATIQTLGLLADAILERDNRAEWARLPELAEQTLERTDAAAEELARRWSQIGVLDAVGAASFAGTAGETALLAREGLRLPATGEETRQYLHGPLEAVDDHFGCVVFGAEREVALAVELAGYGAEVCVVTHTAVEGRSEMSSFVLPETIETAMPVLQIVPMQLAVFHMANTKGLPLGELRRSQADTKVAV